MKGLNNGYTINTSQIIKLSGKKIVENLLTAWQVGEEKHIQLNSAVKLEISIIPSIILLDGDWFCYGSPLLCFTGNFCLTSSGMHSSRVFTIFSGESSRRAKPISSLPTAPIST